MAGILPILGMTVTVAAPEDEIAGDVSGPGQLVLLATGVTGYRSLCRLSSLLQGHPDRETRIAQGLSWETLKTHYEGLICLSGGRMGWVERYVRSGNLAAAHRYADRLVGIYGKNAYLCLELHRPEDRAVAQEILALAQRLGLDTAAVQPVYCLSPQNAPRLRLLAAIDHNCVLDVVPASVLPANGDPDVVLHWLSPNEVAARFAEFPQALVAIDEITSRCEPALPDAQPIWPILKLPEGQTAGEALTELAQAGLTVRYGPHPPQAIQERLERELTAIVRRGYAPLFLVVADVVCFARRAEIPVSTRGSVANSLVAFCLGITTVDPIAHDLLFERFLSPARADPSSYASGQDVPDIDLDFCSRRRDEVLDYVRRTYGADRVALVTTVSTMRPRSALRETAKAYGLDEQEIKRLVAGLPHGWVSTRRRDESIPLDDVLTGLDDARLRQVVRAANDLIGQPHHLSVHPGGVVITPSPLTDFVPVQWAPKGFLMTQFDHQSLEALGLPKLDLLGIRALTVLADTAELVRRHYDPTFRLADIPLDDPATGDLLAQGDTIGVFQCESVGARRTLRQLQARTVQDLAVANAFFKPGPATGGMAQTFIRRYRGEESVAFLHPALAPILSATQGVLLFQEQILRVATEIAGLSWAQANHLRRGMSKMDPVEMAQMAAQFVAGCQRSPPEGPDFTPEQAETLWEQVVAFAGYGFNQGHATAYADVGYRSAYLKAHWPAAFLCARLADRGGFHHPAIYIAEALRLGITVCPPHVNHSNRAFTLDVVSEDKESPILWMGLGQVRDLRRASVRVIVAERQRGPFANLRDLLQRVSLQPKEIAHLVQCGALDGLGASRAALLAEAEEIQRAGSVRQMAFAFAQPAVPAESPGQRLAWERHILGQPVSVHPLELVVERLPDHVPLRHLPELPGRLVTVAGVRLPGWTGARGFFLGDGETFLVARSSEPSPPSWQPLLLRGRWRGDDRGTFWFQAEAIEG